MQIFKTEAFVKLVKKITTHIHTDFTSGNLLIIILHLMRNYRMQL